MFTTNFYETVVISYCHFSETLNSRGAKAPPASLLTTALSCGNLNFFTTYHIIVRSTKLLSTTSSKIEKFWYKEIFQCWKSMESFWFFSVRNIKASWVANQLFLFLFENFGFWNTLFYTNVPNFCRLFIGEAWWWYSSENIIISIRCRAYPTRTKNLEWSFIQGTYPIKPKLPAIGGGEGVGEVLSVGPEVKNLKIGDWVFPGGNMKGTKYGDNRYVTIVLVEH